MHAAGVLLFVRAILHYIRKYYSNSYYPLLTNHNLLEDMYMYTMSDNLLVQSYHMSPST